MASIEETPRKCILKAGSMTLTLDKEFRQGHAAAESAALEQKAGRVRSRRH